MEKVNWKVEGMSCTNCALTIDKYLAEKGLKEVKVNFIGGDLSFSLNEEQSKEEIAAGIKKLGYQVVTEPSVENEHQAPKMSIALKRFLFCLPFTLPLMLHMIPGVHIHFLMNPMIQLGLTFPVFIAGMRVFGKSAWNSLMHGIPNMNLLIAIGAIAAFGYSLYGTLIGQAQDYLFYETAATIITLVFMGNWLEDKAVETTQSALRKLANNTLVMANMIAYDDKHEEHVFPVLANNLKVGDLILLKSGEPVPMDAKILWGEISVSEAIISGEAAPVLKLANHSLIGGSLVLEGTAKAMVTAVGEETVLANILKMVKEAQTEKPPIQQLADRISAIFVPTVIGIALFSFLINYWVIDLPFSDSLLRSIAVLVISCPCAMGLATPAAIAVGLGRAAKNGVLFKNAKSLELFKDIQQVVFDKTGTLTTGAFSIHGFGLTASAIAAGIDETNFKKIAYSLEKFSNHPMAKAISKEWRTKDLIRWNKVEEIKGSGMTGIDKEGNVYKAGSFKWVDQNQDLLHNIYLLKNDEYLGWIDLADEIRVEAKQVIQQLTIAGIKPILLSGDHLLKCQQVAKELGIEEIYAEQSPAQKLAQIDLLNKIAPTAMVGDGINDAPALAKATVGISLSDASHIAMQSAQVVLMNFGIKNLPLSLGLGKHTYRTIKENLFWAFAYNIVAIPVAAMGFLSPGLSALMMGFSDVVLAINSVRLRFKKLL